MGGRKHLDQIFLKRHAVKSSWNMEDVWVGRDVDVLSVFVEVHNCLPGSGLHGIGRKSTL